MRNIAANALSLMIVGGIVLAIVIVQGRQQFVSPGPLTEETLVSLEPGVSLRETSELLAKSGAIDSEMIFRLGTRYSGRDRDIKFGEYLIPKGASMEEILGLLVSGKTQQYKVTVPEGLTSHQVVALLGEAEILTGDAPEAPPEGRIAPDTHFVARDQSRGEVLARMLAAQEQILAEAWESRQADLPLKTPDEMLILASIVQSEAGLGELPQVASVFVNRLRRGQKLEADATVRYGLTLGKEKIRRGLRRSELNKATPYNTYQITGLPPTPISNPGRAAIEAVANPAQTDYLYFVADGSGGHAFAKTFAEHKKNVVRWREIEKQRQTQSD